MEEARNVALILQALATVAIAGFAGIIAWKQYVTAKAKLRLDLFERRFRVYRGLMDLLGAAASESRLPNDALGKFYKETDEKRFLFGPDVTDYLREVREKVTAMQLALKRADALADDPSRESDRASAIDSGLENEYWLQKQIEEAQHRFAKYLDFRENL